MEERRRIRAEDLQSASCENMFRYSMVWGIESGAERFLFDDFDFRAEGCTYCF